MIKKTIFSCILVLSLIGISFNAVADERPVYSSDYVYDYIILADGTIRICTFFNDRADIEDEEILEVPAQIDGYTVTEIDEATYRREDKVKTVILPDTLRVIGDECFYECTELVNVELPDGLEIIGNEAFGQSALDRIVIPDSIKQIGRCAFRGTKIAEFVLPEDTEFESEKLWYGMYCLEKAEIPKFMTEIGDESFCMCRSLKEVDIHDDVTSIGEYAFSECESLEAIDLPDGMTTIGNFAFQKCDSLESIHLPAELKEIGLGAFSSCDSLKEIVIPDKVETIGVYAFEKCWNIESITVPASVTEIGDGAFDSCNDLTVKAPKGSVAYNYCIENNIPVIELE